jgi:hypothetical protein
LCEAEAAHRRVAVDPDAKAVEDAARLVAHAPRIDDARPAGRGLAEEDVLGHRQVRNQAQFLVDRADADLACPQRTVELDRSAIEENLAGVGANRAAENLHQRRLARAVLARHHVDLSGTHVQVGAD